MTVEHPTPYLILQGPDGKLDAFLTECLRLRGAAMPTPGNIATGRLRILSHTSSHRILTLHSAHRTPSLAFETMLPRNAPQPPADQLGRALWLAGVSLACCAMDSFAESGSWRWVLVLAP